MSRLWSRDLTRDEVNTIRSYTLCGSFMQLDSVENGLALSDSEEKATSDFSFMKSEVEKHSAEVIQLVQQSFAEEPNLPQPSAYPNLLAWEEAILGSYDEA